MFRRHPLSLGNQRGDDAVLDCLQHFASLGAQASKGACPVPAPCCAAPSAGCCCCCCMAVQADEAASPAALRMPNPFLIGYAPVLLTATTVLCRSR